MFSFCFLHSSSTDAGRCHSDQDERGIKTLITVTPLSPNHDLSSLYAPDAVDRVKSGTLSLDLMASPSLLGSSSAPRSIVMTRNHSSSSLVTQGPSPSDRHSPSDRPSMTQMKGSPSMTQMKGSSSMNQMKFEESCKWSYNVSTLNRINLLESVTKQTVALSKKSQSSLQTHLLALQPSRDVTCRFEKLNRRVECLRRVLEVSKEKVESVREERTATRMMVGDRRDEMEERVQLLRSMIGRLNGKRSELDQEKMRLYKCRRQLETKRAQFLLDLSTLVYPIEIPQSPMKTVVCNGRTTLKACSVNIAGFSLPDPATLSPKHSFWGHSSSTSSLTNTPGRERKDDIGDHSCIAIGYVVHLLLILSRLTDTPLKYDIEYCGSRSLIIDHLNNEILNTFYVQSSWRTSEDLETDERKVRRNQGVKVTLYLKNKGSRDSRMYFKYGLYLVNQVVAQLNWTLDFVALRNRSYDPSMKSFIPNQRIDISNTLVNLNQLMSNYIKSYPPDPSDKCLLTGTDEESYPSDAAEKRLMTGTDESCSSDETSVYQEAKSMLEANNSEERKETNNHVHNQETTPLRTD